ncbi:MAG: DNA recombination/repair protein RecA [Chloroflexi bacterium]|nr:MAG: DNA recombination/repair protein RecA [Chloroflexota bacterium]
MTDSLSAALATLRRRYGPEALRRGGLPEAAAVWPTGVPVLDGVLVPGGLPRGRLTVLAATARHGPSGRLSLLQSLAATASRSCDVGYVDLAGSLDPGYLADLGADLDACLVLTPGEGRWERGLVMARTLVNAGLPWLAVVCVIAAPAPQAAPLAHASSLTLACTATGWQRAHGDVTGLRVRVVTAKSKVHTPSAEAMVLLRYPRPYAVAEVVGLPTVVTPRLRADSVEALPRVVAAPG